MVFVIILGKEMGLRIHKAVRLSRTEVERAFREGFLTVKGKGGLLRHVPLNDTAASTLKLAIKDVPRSQKLFVTLTQKVHQVIQHIQNFIKNNRHKIIDPLNTRPAGIEITMHSFSHAYAKEHYDAFLLHGYTETNARLKVAQLIGHNREDVTKIYLAEN